MKDKMIRYGLQLLYLRQLLSQGLISEQEHSEVKNKLMKDYKVLSDWATKYDP